MTTILTEGPRNLAFILREASGTRSRDVLTILAGSGKLQAGTVLGMVTASEKYTASPNAEVVGKEGAETASAILGYSVDATDEDVDVTCINGDAEVKAPMLVFDASIDDTTKQAAKITQLRAVNIKAR